MKEITLKDIEELYPKKNGIIEFQLFKGNKPLVRFVRSVGEGKNKIWFVDDSLTIDNPDLIEIVGDNDGLTNAMLLSRINKLKSWAKDNNQLYKLAVKDYNLKEYHVGLKARKTYPRHKNLDKLSRLENAYKRML